MTEKTRLKPREFNAAVSEAYQDAYAATKPAACVNNSGSVKSECKCQGCTAARASNKKAQELVKADVQPLSEEEVKERAFAAAEAAEA